jgi:hypothetical protein
VFDISSLDHALAVLGDCECRQAPVRVHAHATA